MPTNITTSANPTYSQARQVVRDSSGNIIALVQESSSAIAPYISSDGGSSWQLGDTTFSSDNGMETELVIDSTDTLHVACRDPSDTTNLLYHQFSVDTSGTVTTNVSSETLWNGSKNYTMLSVDLAIDGNDVPWAIIPQENKSMGTSYESIVLRNRSGGSWSTIGTVSSTTTNKEHFTMAFDGVGDLHIAWAEPDTTSTEYAKWDVSAGSVSIGPETITATGTYNGNIALNSSDEPLVASHQTVWRRSGGTWSGDQFTDDSVNECSIGLVSGDILVAYTDSNANVKYNKAAFGSFDTTAETTVKSASGSEAFQDPVVRWQQHNMTSGDIDVIYYDYLAGDVEWFSVSGTVTVSETTSISAAASPSTSETGSGTESTQVTPTLTTTTGETGKATDAVQLAAALSTATTEKSIVVETSSATISFSSSTGETGKGTEIAQVTATFSGSTSEVGKATEAAALVAALDSATSETGRATESTSLGATVTLSTSESIPSTSVSETASLSIAATTTADEIGKAAEAVSILISAALSTTETGKGADSASVSGALSGSTSETGSGTDSTSLSALTSLNTSESGVGTPASASLSATVSTDATAGQIVTEAASVLASASTATDEVGKGSENTTLIATFGTATSETGRGTESSGLDISVASATDESGAASETTQLTVSVPTQTSEVGKASESTAVSVGFSAETVESVVAILDTIDLDSVRSIRIDLASAKKIIAAVESERDLDQALKSTQSLELAFDSESDITQNLDSTGEKG